MMAVDLRLTVDIASECESILRIASWRRDSMRAGARCGIARQRVESVVDIAIDERAMEAEQESLEVDYEE